MIWTVKEKQVYNLKSQKTPPNNKQLDPLEVDLFKLIKNIRFRSDYNTFQKKLTNDIIEFKSSKCIWVRADKSKNVYKINPSKYQEILRNFKIDYKGTICQINNDTCKFANKLHIEDRLGKFKRKDAYILIKDHKPNFENKLQSRLINPSKTELGKELKNIIQNINNVKKN